jgi:uncharacterized protein (DUF2384 family)
MDVLVSCPTIWRRAVLIFGSEEKAGRWFRTKLSELHDRTPEEALDGTPDNQDVSAILDRIEYGVFS